MNLSHLIDFVGPVRMAEKLNVDLSTVYRWKNLQTVPEPETAFKIVSKYKDRISMNEIYLPMFKNRKPKVESDQLEFDLE